MFRFAYLALVCLPLALVSACTGYNESKTISNGPPPSAAQQALEALPTVLQDQVKTDLLQTAINFDNALLVGKAVTDFDACSHLINQGLGIETVPGTTAPTTAQMTNKGLFSLGSILVVQFLDTSANGLSISVPSNCLAAYGQLQLQAQMQGLSKLPGGSLIQVKAAPALSAAQIKAMTDAAVLAAAARAAAASVPTPAPAAPAPAPAPAAASPASPATK